MLTEFCAKLYTFHWNSNITFGKFQYFDVFYWKLQGNSALGFQNRVISDLTVYVFQ